jgi:hypothetical protein
LSTSNNYNLYIYGNTAGGYAAVFFVYSSLTNTWKQLPNGYLGLRAGSGAYHVETNSILIVSGYSNNIDRYLANNIFYTQRYQIDSMEWTLESPRTLKEMLSDSSANMVQDDYIITIGGEKLENWNYLFKNTSIQECFSSKMHILDTFCGEWTSRNIPNLQRKGHATIVRDNKAFVFGGNSGVLLNDILEINLDLPTLSEDEKYKCKAKNYCGRYHTLCKSCQSIPYCNWCNDACGYNTDRPQSGLTQTLPKGQLNGGLCPISTNSSIKAECPISKININPVPYIATGKIVLGNVTYGSYNDYQITVFAAYGKSINFLITEQTDSNGKLVENQIRMSLINTQPYSLTTKTGIISIPSGDYNFQSYYMIRISLANSNGVKAQIPFQEDESKTNFVSYKLIVYTSGPVNNDSNEFLIGLMAIALSFVSVITGVSFYLKRRRLRQYGSFLLAEPQVPFSPPSLFKVMIQINSLDNQSSLESITESSRPTLENLTNASTQIKRSVRLLIPEQESVSHALALEQISITHNYQRPVLLTNESFIIVWPGKERHLKRGDLPPMKIATNVRVQDCENIPKADKQKPKQER